MVISEETYSNAGGGKENFVSLGGRYQEQERRNKAVTSF